MVIAVRPERAGDIAEIRMLVSAAFRGPLEPKFVDAVRAGPEYIPELALVAELDGSLAGHVMFSRVWLDTGSERLACIQLAPLAVRPDVQRRGIGSALVREGLRIGDERREALAVVLGIPAYYPRFGFVPSRTLGIEPPDPRVLREAYMARRMRAYDARYRGRIVTEPGDGSSRRGP